MNCNLRSLICIIFTVNLWTTISYGEYIGNLEPPTSFASRIGGDIADVIQGLAQQKQQQQSLKERAQFWESMGISHEQAMLLVNQPEAIQVTVLEKIQKQQQQQNLEQRFKANHPDIDNVLSSANLKQLQLNYPEVTANINKISDFYTRKKTTYVLIKQLGIYPKKIKQQQVTKPEKITENPFSNYFLYSMIGIGSLIILLLLFIIGFMIYKHFKKK